MNDTHVVFVLKPISENPKISLRKIASDIPAGVRLKKSQVLNVIRMLEQDGYLVCFRSGRSTVKELTEKGRMALNGSPV